MEHIKKAAEQAAYFHLGNAEKVLTSGLPDQTRIRLVLDELRGYVKAIRLMMQIEAAERLQIRRSAC